MKEKQMQCEELAAYLNDYLRIREVPDYKDAFNGLQVEGKRDVRRVAVAVDACLYTIEQAVASAADLLLVHHGLFWGAKAPVTGGAYRRLSLLIKNDLALYSSHLPLDVHPEVGNNHVLARRLGLEPSEMFAEYEGVPLGVIASTELPRSHFVERVHAALGVNPFVISTGPETVRRVGILTGGGGALIAAAAAKGIDTYLTGEGAHHTYFEAEERGLNVLYAGHYATETIGVRALADHLTRQFGLETLFLDHPTGL
jgi:dinuclear metal center YbgI/SA1388 family protein